MQTYFPPKFRSGQFNCPNCDVYAKQSWYDLYYKLGPAYIVEGFNIAYCTHCVESSLWYNGRLVIPDVTSAPLPHLDMPECIKEDYNEAASILSKSPRGAAALLRLALQKLLKELGEPGKDINKDIGSLVKKGLPVQVQQALDIVRVIGNESVHPGELDIRDDFDTATQLFILINFIIDNQIAHPKKVEELFSKLPANKLAGIEQRDKAKTP